MRPVRACPICPNCGNKRFKRLKSEKVKVQCLACNHITSI